MMGEKISMGEDTLDGTTRLVRLRDFLDLPRDSLDADGRLVFMLDSGRCAIASCTPDAHLSLICEIARLDALDEEAWRMLALRMAEEYDPAFPVSLIGADGHLALVWVCRADIRHDEWLNRVEDALTSAYAISAELALASSHSPSSRSRPAFPRRT
jgi:hypothetical protein